MEMAWPVLLPCGASLPTWLRRCMELRIDVDAASAAASPESLARLHARIHTPGTPLYGMPSLPMDDPRFRLHHREADGEWYAYVEDVARGRLAGTTVFNRLVEVDRRTDRLLRAPHSRYDPAYQRQGLASAVYRRALADGMCLLSGARQSPGAHALWLSLARSHGLLHVQIRQRRLHCLGTGVDASVRDALATRLLLLPPGWTELQALEAGVLQA